LRLRAFNECFLHFPFLTSDRSRSLTSACRTMVPSSSVSETSDSKMPLPALLLSSSSEDTFAGPLMGRLGLSDWSPSYVSFIHYKASRGEKGTSLIVPANCHPIRKTILATAARRSRGQDLGVQSRR
jgi:hypothetical protein